MAHNDPIPPHLNPAAGAFAPVIGTQVSSISSLELRFKVEDLEREQACSRAEVANLKTLCHTLRTEIETIKKGGWNVTPGPIQDHSDSHFTKALDAVKEKANGGAVLSQDARTGCCSNANVSEKKPSGATVPPHLRSQKTSSTISSVPPHLRVKTGAGFVTVAPHLRHGGALGVPGKSPEAKASVSPANNPLVTDGTVDSPEADLVRQKAAAVAREPTPPLSPKSLGVQTSSADEHMSSAVQQLSIADRPTTGWKPHPVAILPELSPDITSKIPSARDTVSFAGDFLRNSLGGIIWGPGLVFVPPPQSSLLPDRVYYTVDPSRDPHLPSTPGQHGAKLVPFFNINPEDSLLFDLPETFDSTSNVPLFVLRDEPGRDGKTRKRYVYYGHYTQSRWSDKLDYDRMLQCVPGAVREYWAEELCASGRPEWVTDALQKHFFPVPAYGGALPAVAEAEGGSVAEDAMAAREKKVARDVGRHVAALRAWKKEADMRTNLIRKDFILKAFDQADADEPKALCFWWEYLECVDWRADFYDTLVTLQSRNDNYV